MKQSKFFHKTKNETLNFYANNNVLRLIAIQVVIISSIYIFTHWIYLLCALLLDFSLRAFTQYLSPLSMIAKMVAGILKIKSSPIFAAPKKFAASIGFVFSLLALMLHLFHSMIGSSIFVGIILICALLESCFKVCVGCYLHDWLIAPIINSRNSEIEEETWYV